MAESLISSVSTLLGKTNFKIMDRLGFSYWADLRIISVEIMGDAQTAESPLGTNELSDSNTYTNLLDIDISNGKILRPVNMKVKAICANPMTVESIMRAFTKTENLYDITSRKVSAYDMMMKNAEIMMSSEMISAVTITIEWEQAAPAIYNPFNPNNPSNDTSYGLRIKTPSDVIPVSLSGLGNNIVSSAESLYNKVSKTFGV